MKKFILTLFLLSLCINIKAYENDYFKIDIPNNYKDEIINDTTYKWSNSNNYISITISNNLYLNYNIEAYTQKDMDNQKKYIQDNINNSLKENNISVDVSDIEKILLNGNYTLKYKIFWPSQDIIGYNKYQIGNVFTTKNYIINVVYSSDNESIDEYNLIINSFKLKDKVSKVITYKEFLTFIVIASSIIAIIIVIINQKNKK